MKPDSVMLACCELCNIPLWEMQETGRHKKVTRARENTVAAMRYFTHLSFPEIANKFGRTNHSSAHTQFGRWLKRDQSEREKWLDDVAAKLGLPTINAARAATPPSRDTTSAAGILETPEAEAA